MEKDKVLVTGVSGYIGAHVLDLLLKSGYSVRGTVRSQQKADQIKEKYPLYKDKLEFAFVGDIAKDGAFDHVLDDSIVGIFHLASPVTFAIKDNKTDLLDPAIKGTTGILEAALKYPEVKRVVITSSFAAICDPFKVGNNKYVYTEKDWNPMTMESALTAVPPLAYCASKKFSEWAAYDFLSSKKPHFDIVTLCPTLVVGPLEHPIKSFSELNESVKEFYLYAMGIRKVEPPTNNLFVDVRDVANALLLSYEKKEAKNERYLINAGSFDWQDVVDVVHKHFPNQTNADKGDPSFHYPPSFMVDNSKSVQQLGVVYRPKEETFKDTVEQLVKFKELGY